MRRFAAFTNDELLDLITALRRTPACGLHTEAIAEAVRRPRPCAVVHGAEGYCCLSAGHEGAHETIGGFVWARR